MEIRLGFNRLEVAEKISREVAMRMQLISETAANFEVLTITDADEAWVKERIITAAKLLHADLHPYATSLFIVDQRIEYDLVLPDNFNVLQEETLNEAMIEIVSKTVAGDWFWEKAQGEVKKELQTEVAGLVSELKAILYQWRVERSEKSEIIKEAIVVEEGGVNYNYLVIGVSHEAVLEQTKEDVNTTLKSTLSGTDEYEKYKISNIHSVALLRTAKKGLNEVAENSYGYAVEWEDHILENTLLSKIATLRGATSTGGSSNPYYMLVLRMPSTFNEESINPIAESFESVLVSKSIGEYFVGVGLHDPSKHYFLQEEKELLSIKEVLYQWRVERSEDSEIIESAILVVEGEKKYNYLVIGVPYDVILRQVKENINATLKTRLPSTDEYERFKVKDLHTPVLSKAAKRNLNTIADRAQAYVVMWKDDAIEQEVHEVISQLKEVENINEEETPYFLIVFRVPENFNRASIRTIAESINSSLISNPMHRYFTEIGLTDISEFYMLQEEIDLKDIMSLLHRRTKPIRRGGNFFS